jgi:biopolymer transport protein TolR
MGMGTNSGGSRRGYLAEINVTPLVDVMLVLLIIFMVTAPMMTRGLDVKLPETTAKALPQKKENVVITINAKSKLFLDKSEVSPGFLKQKLAELVREGRAGQVLLRADESVKYGDVAVVMTAIREAGVKDLGLVTAPAPSSSEDKTGQKADSKRNSS